MNNVYWFGNVGIVQNKNVQQIPDKALTLLNHKLDEYISDFTKEEVK